MVLATKPVSDRELFGLLVRRLLDMDVSNRDYKLISIRKARSLLPVSKTDFDRMMIEASYRDLVTMHHHDHPAGVSAADRDLMLKEDNNYYIGFVLNTERLVNEGWIS